jgi:hypothetical protein
MNLDYHYNPTLYIYSMGKQGLFGLNGKESPTPPPNVHPNMIWQVRLSKSSFRYVGIDPLQPLFLLFFFFFF